MRQADTDPKVLGAVLTALFPDARLLSFQRTPDGVSTPVYRVRVDDWTYYLRLAETPAASLVPEVQVHRLLTSRAVHVPEVVAFEPCHPLLGRSLMVTSAIAGMPIDEHLTIAQRQAIAMAAGRDLAKINRIPVAGFGWIDRTTTESDHLRAEYPTWPTFVAATLDD
ncbi:MAG: aminoglycoside phosphotransferase family protein, partial [Chloroflexota bacterium]|nr:aminoglycoside phosphotransferase family protein [Chloroflexota bacterium]